MAITQATEGGAEWSEVEGEESSGDEGEVTSGCPQPLVEHRFRELGRQVGCMVPRCLGLGDQAARFMT